VNTPLAAHDISEVKILKNGVVYLLIGHHNDRIVLKRDRAVLHPPSVKPMISVMKAVDSLSKMKLLSPHEVVQLMQWAQAVEELYEFYERHGLPRAANIHLTEKRIVKQLLDVLREPAPWMKMDVLE